MIIQEFIKKLKEKNVELSEVQLAQFEDYRKLLQEYNKKINLTAIIETDEIYIKHFYDSLIPAFHHDIKGSLLDVGAGAGFPSLPLKIVFPNLDVTILEPITKRTNFLQVVTSKLDLDVKIVNKRAEDYIRESFVKYDFVTARAVANMQILAELCIPFAKVNGYFIAMKGSRYQAELDASNNALIQLKSSIENVFEDELDGAVRATIFIKKVANTSSKYPRNYSQIKQKPL